MFIVIVMSALLCAIIIFIIFSFVIFARDSYRKIHFGIISPADGKVVVAKDGCVAIEMGLCDVHINRIPYDGKVISVKHYSGKHFWISSKRFKENEHAITDICTKYGIMRVIQRAGIFGRRIKVYVKESQYVKKGDKLGAILFGSRVEIYYPKNIGELVVKHKDKLLAGETICKLND